MARLNISIPDPLHERLERARDRVNISKVCAVALEKEIDMLEARPSVADPKIAHLLQRLQGTKDLWYHRGHEDGLAWGVEHATRSDLQTAANELDSCDGTQLALALERSDDEDDQRNVLPMLPGIDGLGRLWKKTDPWVLRDLQIEKEPAYGSYGSKVAETRSRFDEARAAADDHAYLEGWRDALVELWKAVAPALRH